MNEYLVPIVIGIRNVKVNPGGTSFNETLEKCKEGEIFLKSNVKKKHHIKFFVKQRKVTAHKFP